MPPHWWIPVKASDPKVRKKDVEDALTRRGGSNLTSFWVTPDGQQLFALIQAEALDHDLLRDIGANGKPVAVEDV
ncbi:MAG: hypothetical protein ABI649_06410 [Gaiellaceae bacterium]